MNEHDRRDMLTLFQQFFVSTYEILLTYSNNPSHYKSYLPL